MAEAETQVDDFELDGGALEPEESNEAETAETPAGETPTPEPQQENTEETGLNKGEKSYLSRQKLIAERAKAEAKALREELDAMKAKQGETLGPEPSVPEIPEQFDENFQEKMAARDAAVQERQKWDQEKQRFEAERQQLEQRRAMQQQAEHQRQMQEREKAYRERVNASGLSEDDVTRSLTTVVQAFEYRDDMGNAHSFMPDSLRDVLVQDEASPLIAKFLADNPDAGAELAGMEYYQGLQHLMTEVKPRALALKPKPSTAPPPPEQLDGGGKVELDHPALKGATIE